MKIPPPGADCGIYLLLTLPAKLFKPYALSCGWNWLVVPELGFTPVTYFQVVIFLSLYLCIKAPSVLRHRTEAEWTAFFGEAISSTYTQVVLMFLFFLFLSYFTTT